MAGRAVIAPLTVVRADAAPCRAAAVDAAPCRTAAEVVRVVEEPARADIAPDAGPPLGDGARLVAAVCADRAVAAPDAVCLPVSSEVARFGASAGAGAAGAAAGAAVAGRRIPAVLARGDAAALTDIDGDV